MRLYHEVEGEGEPVVLIGGYACDLTYWDCVRKNLAHRYRLILPDNRGVGRSPAPQESFTVAEMADDIHELIQSLGVNRPHIIGHSMGGCIAQSLAARYSQGIGKVVFYQTCVKIRPVSAAALAFSLHLFEDKASVRLQAEALLPWLFSNSFLADPKLCDTYFKSVERQPYPNSIEGLKKQFEALLNFDSRRWYTKIDSPSLVICGESDLICSPQDSQVLAKSIPGAKLHIFSDMGHMSHIEQPETFCKVISEFFD